MSVCHPLSTDNRKENQREQCNKDIRRCSKTEKTWLGTFFCVKARYLPIEALIDIEEKESNMLKFDGQMKVV